MATSKLGKKLRAMGFEKVPNLTVSRAQKAKFPPSFTCSGDPEITFATDEWGQSWMKPAVVDLSPLGFNNTSAQARQELETMGVKAKPH